jgi:hypothetical protein
MDMKHHLILDMIRLAFSKKKFFQKVFYIFQGVIFIPFLVYEEKSRKRQGRNSANSNHEGDDVYPLF